MATHHEVDWTPVPWTRVTLDGGLWGERQRVNRERTIPAVYRQLKDTGRLDAFRLDWQPGRQPVPHQFWDSDVAKWLEAAAYSLGSHPDRALAALVDDTVALVASAQRPDGYLNTHFTAVEPHNRWTNLRDMHELYCAGHLIEAAVAHYDATGKTTLLAPVRRYADTIDAVFGAGPGQKRGYCGHEEIELALIRLAHATNDTRYRRLAGYFVDERGRRPHYFDQEARARGEDPAAFWAGSYAYNQAHIPVREQTEVVGHAVRAMYLYSAMADLARETDDAALAEACQRLWTHLTSGRLYITGGIGPSRDNEGFTADYDLPNETAYAETCAAIGLVFWAQRMARLEHDGRYTDVLEQALYNGVLSGVSLDGETFFYENPLASDGGHLRQPWYSCACCPPNIARLIASVGGYVYAQGEADAVIHLYAHGRGRLSLGGGTVTLRQDTGYPWDGCVSVTLEMAAPMPFRLWLRRPGWAREATLRVNGAEIDPDGVTVRGYMRLERTWRPGDEVTVEFPMPVERVYAHPDIAADAGRVALRRGPLVYCVEGVDVGVPLRRLRLPRGAEFAPVYEEGLLGGVIALRGEALAAASDGWGEGLYRAGPPSLRPTPLTAIPYYAWDNRAPAEMAVWLVEDGGT
ncbi:MAG: glycoside hydrolase family 127 protein [Anaerolineae bacterium]